MISVFIVDDHYMVVEGIRSLLQQEKNIELIGHAPDGAGCKAFLQLDLPDVLLLDINLPDISGIDLCKTIKEQFPSVMILALTTFNQETVIRKMLENGASGYVLKNATSDELSEAIHAVNRGRTFFSYDVARTLRNSAQNISGVPVLTRREKEVLELIAEGYTTQEMADKLFIGTTTIDTHRKSLLVKMNAKNTAALVKRAVIFKFISFE